MLMTSLWWWMKGQPIPALLPFGTACTGIQAVYTGLAGIGS